MLAQTIPVMLEREQVKAKDLFHGYSFIINCIFWKYNLMHFGNKCQNLQAYDLPLLGLLSIKGEGGNAFCSRNENAKEQSITLAEYLHRSNYITNMIVTFMSRKNQDPIQSNLRSTI